MSSGPEPCGIERGGVYVNVAHYLEWIHLAKLQDMVDDFKVIGLSYFQLKNFVTIILGYESFMLLSTSYYLF